MIIVAHKSTADNNFRYDPEKRETYRLINTVYHEINGVVAICERLFDEYRSPFDAKPIEKKKGDLFTTEIKYLRVIHSSSTEDDEMERKKYLDELRLLVHNKPQ